MSDNATRDELAAPTSRDRDQYGQQWLNGALHWYESTCRNCGELIWARADKDDLTWAHTSETLAEDDTPLAAEYRRQAAESTQSGDAPWAV